MKDSTGSCIYVFVAISFMFGMAGCSANQDDLDQAYRAGHDSAWREKCQDQELPLMMPSQFDDSTGKGELVSMYRSGYANAQADPNLCK